MAEAFSSLCPLCEYSPVDTRPTPAASVAASVTSPRQLTLLCALLASGTLAIVTTFLPWISHPTVTGSHALVHNGLLMPTYSTGEGEGDQNIGGGPNGVTTLAAGVLLLALAVLLACTFDRSAPREPISPPYPRWVTVTGTACGGIALSLLVVALISALVTHLTTTVVILTLVATVLAAIGAVLALLPAGSAA